MREWIARLRDWLRRDRLDRELQEELRFHREHLERDARYAGADAEAARLVAKRRLGNEPRVREESRDRWSWPWLDHFQKDVRYAFRGLRRSPGFTTTVILTFGLGIGANAAMFGVIDRLMFRPYPYLRDPGTVHRVYLQTTSQERTSTRAVFPYSRYLDLRKWTTSFSQFAAIHSDTFAVGTSDASRERLVAAVSAGFFDFFDIRPVLGRFFVAAEDRIPVGAEVAVLSYAFWQAEFGGRNVLGETIQVHNILCTIIGVAPRGFTGMTEGGAPAVFLPITTFGGNQYAGSPPDYFRSYYWDWTEMMVRRKPGVSVATASNDLTNAFVRSRVAARAVHPNYAQVERASPRAVAGALKASAGPAPGLEARTLLWVSGVAVIVLLIACANVANLMVARALRRRREIAVRLALGVSKRRLASQFLIEGLLLAVIGGLAGLALAQGSGTVLRRLFLRGDSSLEVLTDWRTLSVAAAFALGSGVLTALGPVILAARGNLAATLKAGSREGTYSRSRARSVLLVLQGALSVVLLVGAGLFVQSLKKVREVHLGYDVNPVLVVRWDRRGFEMTADQRVASRRRFLEAALAVPGVDRAAWASSVPLDGTSTYSLSIQGIDSVARLGRFTFQTAGPDYFATIGTRILRGRPFAAGDRAGAPAVMVVSEGMARTLWPGQEALGQCVRVGADTMPCSTVIGIAEDAMHDPVSDERLRYYLPIEQYAALGGSGLFLRMRGDPAAAVERVRSTLQALAPAQSYVVVRPMREAFDDQRRSWQVGATMFVAFGALALLVAAVGLYGVIAYNVVQRTHELGVRIALGAQSGDVVRLVVSQGVWFAAAGVGIGLGLALLSARWIQPLLFEQSARDPATYGLVGAVLLAVAILASALPAFRATKADPNSALRSE